MGFETNNKCPLCAANVFGSFHFCPCCGEHLGGGLPLEIFARFGRMVKRVNRLRIIQAIITFGAVPFVFFAMYVVERVMLPREYVRVIGEMLTIACVFIFFGGIVYMVVRLMRGVKCSACGKYIFSDVLNNKFSRFCPECGVRYRAGFTGADMALHIKQCLQNEGEEPDVEITRHSAKLVMSAIYGFGINDGPVTDGVTEPARFAGTGQRDNCGFCGALVVGDHRYCHSCGGCLLESKLLTKRQRRAPFKAFIARALNLLFIIGAVALTLAIMLYVGFLWPKMPGVLVFVIAMPLPLIIYILLYKYFPFLKDRERLKQHGARCPGCNFNYMLYAENFLRFGSINYCPVCGIGLLAK